MVKTHHAAQMSHHNRVLRLGDFQACFIDHLVFLLLLFYDINNVWYYWLHISIIDIKKKLLIVHLMRSFILKNQTVTWWVMPSVCPNLYWSNSGRGVEVTWPNVEDCTTGLMKMLPGLRTLQVFCRIKQFDGAIPLNRMLLRRTVSQNKT